MMIPDMGHLIVSQFNLVLFFVSKAQCLIFLLLRSLSPHSNLHWKEVTIIFVVGYHFVSVTFHTNIFLLFSNQFYFLSISKTLKFPSQVILSLLHLVPNVELNWHGHGAADGWNMPYLEQIKHFRSVHHWQQRRRVLRCKYMLMYKIFELICL